MNWRNLCLGILLPSALLMGPRVVCAPTVSGQLSKAGLAYDIEPSCAACGKRGGGNPNCSACGGGGPPPDGGGQGGDITHAPIFVAPVGMISGIFMGGGWYFSEMAGNYPKQGFFSSYHQYLSVDSKDPLFDKPFNFGTQVGGLPWMALFVPTWPVRQGIVYLGRERPSPPPKPRPPPDPNIAVYESISKTYAGLAKETEVRLQRLTEQADAARLRRSKLLDDFIARHPDLVALAKGKGMEAARARAKKRLDAWSQALDNRRGISQQLQAQINEDKQVVDGQLQELKKTLCLTAINELFPKIAKSPLEQPLDSDTLTQAERGALRYRRFLFDRSFAWASGPGVDLEKEIVPGAWQANRDGSLVEWYEKPETQEKMERFSLHLLGTLRKAGKFASPAGDAELAIDVSYSCLAASGAARRIMASQAQMGHLAKVRVSQDVAATAWDEANLECQAREFQEERGRKLLENYSRQEKDNARKANALRK